MNEKIALHNLFEEICNRLRLEGEGHLEVSYIDLDENKRSLATEIVFVTFRDLAPVGPNDHSRLALSHELFDPARFTSYKELKDNLYQVVKQYYYNWRQQQFMGATPGTLSQDPLRARVEAGAYRLDGLGASVRPVDSGSWSVRISDKAAEKLRANSVYGSSLGSTQAHTSAPWDDPLKGMQDKANNTVACMDMNEAKNPDGSFNLNISPTIYYHDRFPSIPVREIVNDAILMLRAKKRLNISIHSFNKEGDDYRLIYKVLIDNAAPDLKQGKLIECVLTKKAFDRISSEVDRYAGLKARLDTNTFLKLRIAYLLYSAQKVSCDDAKKIILDIFHVIGSSSHPIFNY